MHSPLRLARLTVICALALVLVGSESTARSRPDPSSFGFIDTAAPQQSEPCLSPDQRSAVRASIEHNREELDMASGPAAQRRADPVLLGWPLRARDGFTDPGYYFVSGYVDHDPASPGSLLDWNCGSRTYDTSGGYNHSGTDLAAWPFPWYKMDHDDVEIVAAAAGIIVGRIDGNYDRNCAFGAGGWNAVYVEHADGSIAWYGHMKNGSVTGKLVGESVAKGEYLGLVGSSGNSSGPHLHFEYYDALGVLTDPWAGSCNPTTAASLWDDQKPYHDSSLNQLRTHGAFPEFLGCGVQEVVDFQNAFAVGDTSYVIAYFRDVLAGQDYQIDLITPDGTPWLHWDMTWPSDGRTRTFWARFVPQDYDQTGEWTWRVNYDSQVYEHVFSVFPKAFADVATTDMAGISGGQEVAWGDFDDDGDDDLYLTNDGSANVLLRNDAGSFVDVTAGPLGHTGAGRSAAMIDYDNDGDGDLYLVNYNTSNVLLRNDAGAFSDVTAGPLGNTGPGQSAVWADYDLDGDLDVYLVNSGQPNLLLRNDGGDVFADATPPILADANLAYDAAWSDVDGDGDADLYLAVYGNNRMFRNDGGGSFSDVTTAPLNHGGIASGVGFGDYDNDGDPDLYLANYLGPNVLLRNDGGMVFTDQTTGPLGDTGNANSFTWGDYDNDGDIDLYVANSGGPDVLLRNDGAGVFSDATSAPLGHEGNSQSAAWADYDQDGDLDLYLVDRTGPHSLYRNDGGTLGNGGFAVRLRGTQSNSDGIGARVRLLAGPADRTVAVGDDSGGSHGSRTLSFGLGAWTALDSLTVSWPGGIVQRMSLAGIGTAIEVVEAGPTGSLPALRPARIAPPRPNPFNPITVLQYSLPERTHLRLTVYDVLGRHVYTLFEGEREAGEFTSTWNGTDATGGSAPSGTYVFELRTASGSRRCTRGVLLK